MGLQDKMPLTVIVRSYGAETECTLSRELMEFSVFPAAAVYHLILKADKQNKSFKKKSKPPKG
jgi:hypothetical protein